MPPADYPPRHTGELHIPPTEEMQAAPPEDAQRSTSEIAAAPAEPPPSAVYLELYAPNGKQRLRLDFSAGVVLLGRTDEKDPHALDMTPFGAFEHGVSRQHARFVQQAEGIYIEDLASTNGTRINGYSLKAHKPYLLRNNDELEFGGLRSSVRFVR